MEERLMIKCWNCGNDISGIDKFCNICGKEQKNRDIYKFEYFEKKCWKCNGKIDSNDKYCKHCGSGQKESAKFSYSLLGILLQFFIVGPFCLLRLWQSPIIDKKLKLILTIAILVLTIGAVLFIFYFSMKILDSYSKALNIM